MLNTLHIALLDLDTKTLKSLELWASEECDYDRYSREVATTRVQKEHYNGRLAVHNAFLTEVRTLLAKKGESIYIKGRRDSAKSSE